jgi:hypothetical protein
MVVLVIIPAFLVDLVALAVVAVQAAKYILVVLEHPAKVIMVQDLLQQVILVAEAAELEL